MTQNDKTSSGSAIMGLQGGPLTIPVNVRLTAEQREAVREIAYQERTTVSGWLRKLVEEKLTELGEMGGGEK